MPPNLAIQPNERVVRRLSDPSFHGNMRVLVRHGAYEPWKVLWDFSAAVVLLLATTPLILLAGLLVKLTSRGPIFYFQTRLGKFGQRFRICKIRTMYHNCERLTGARWATTGDARITPVGRILRRFHIDELPQLWNVVCGQMSLVGPRPERPEFMEFLVGIPGYSSRLVVKPGLSGLAQVQLPPDTDLHSVHKKLRFDLYYMRNMGFGLDLRIILATILYLLQVPSRTACRVFALPNESVVEQAEQARKRRPEPVRGPHLPRTRPMSQQVA